MNKDVKIAVAGTGYVGLSIATLLSQHHHVTAVDVIPEKVELINHRKSPIQDDYIEKYLAEKDLDLTATLDTWTVEPADGGVSITLNTRSSNEGSLRPEILLTAIDRVLTDTLKTEPITSTGTPELACFSRIEVERADQYGEDDEGGRIDPL